MPGNDEIIRLILETKGADGLRELARESRAAAKELEATGGAAAKTEKSSVNMGQSLLQGGRALQDFAQGGIGGILNNIEGLASALGGGAGVAGAATAIGIAIAFAGPPVLRFFQSLGASEKEVKSLKEGIEGVSKSLETLTDKTKLSNAETAEFNRLAAEQGKLEKAAADRKAELAAFSAQPKGPKLDKSIGEQVSDAIIPNQAAVAASAASKLSGESGFDKQFPLDPQFDTPALNDLAEKAVQGDTDAASKLHSVPGLTQQDYTSLLLRAKARLGSRTKANQLVTRAMKGDVDAANKLKEILPDGALRDDLVRATTSDRTKDEARHIGSQFLDSTIGKATRSLRDRNARARELGGAQDAAADMEDETNRDIAARDAKAKAEQARADAETLRLKEQAEHARQQQAEQEAREAPKLAEKAQLTQFGQAANQVAASYGEPMTPEMTLQAAQEAQKAAAKGVETGQAILGAVFQVVNDARQTQQAYQQLTAQAMRLKAQMPPPQGAGTFFPGQ